MAFSSAELANIANAALDYYIDQGNVYANTLADKPLLNLMDGKAKTFPGGKSDLSVAVKGVYTTQVAGYTHNDTVAYANPANIQRANYAWKEHHSGISVTLTELKKDGISVTDSTTSNSVTNHSGRDKTVLVNLFQDKLDDMLEGYSRGMNDLLYGDGTADANALAGIRSIIVDDPSATGTTVGDNIANVGFVLMAQSAKIAFGANGSTTTIATLPANSQIFQITLDVTTAFNAGTTNTIDFGDGTTADQFADALAAGSQGRVLATSDVSQIGNLIDVGSSDVQVVATYNQTGSAASAGAATATVLKLCAVFLATLNNPSPNLFSS